MPTYFYSTFKYSRANTKFMQGLSILIILFSWIGVQPAQPVQANDTAFFAVITDFGTLDSTQASVATMVDSWNPEFIVTAGDNWQQSLMDSPGTTNSYENAVGNFYGAGAVSLGRTQNDYVSTGNFWPIKGNHDYSAGPGRFEQYFNYPPYVEHSGNASFYEFVRGPVHFFMMDSGALLASPPDLATQRAWLESAVDASTAAWKIVLFHKPAYTGGVHADNTEMRWNYADWGVDFVIAGHVHIYERILQDGVRYFTAGVASGSTRTGTQEGEFYYSGSGAMRVNASDTSITLEYIAVNGAVIDSFTQTREATYEPRMTVSASSLAAFSSQPGSPSAAQGYTVSGTNLTGNVTVTPPAGFEVSTSSDSGFNTTSIDLITSGGTLPATTIYVRLHRATIGTSSGNISHSSPGAPSQNVAVSGTTSFTTVTVTATLGQTKVYGSADPVFTYSSSHPSVTFSGALSRAIGENVGIYPLNQGTLSIDEGYTINFVPADFTITARTIHEGDILFLPLTLAQQ
jgi:tartrate-resistant acid phosphatase type 5